MFSREEPSGLCLGRTTAFSPSVMNNVKCPCGETDLNKILSRPSCEFFRRESLYPVTPRLLTTCEYFPRD